MLAAIVAAEVAFWLLLMGGLVVRYVVRRRTLSIWILRSVPLVDVALLALVAIDVASGAPPSRAHALAAVYLGVTLAFGHATITWADVRFSHRFAGGPAPTKATKGSPDEVRSLWREWLRVLLAAAVAVGLILALVAVRGWHVPGSADQLAQDPYWATIALIGVVTAIWFLAGPAFSRSSTTPRTGRSVQS